MRHNGLRRIKKREDKWADMVDFVIILGATRTWKLIKLIKFNHRPLPNAHVACTSIIFSGEIFIDFFFWPM